MILLTRLWQASVTNHQEILNFLTYWWMLASSLVIAVTLYDVQAGNNSVHGALISFSAASIAVLIACQDRRLLPLYVALVTSVGAYLSLAKDAGASPVEPMFMYIIAVIYFAALGATLLMAIAIRRAMIPQHWIRRIGIGISLLIAGWVICNSIASAPLPGPPLQ